MNLLAGTVDVPAALLVALAAIGYAAGATVLRRRGDGWPVARSVAFALGLVVVLFATCTFVGAYARSLFWAFTVQVCVLMIVAPLLLGAGAPVTLVRRLRGAAGGRDVTPARQRSWRRSWPGRVLRAVLHLPGSGLLLLVLATSVLFFSPLLDLVLRNGFAFHLLQVALVGVGLLMALPVTDEATSLSSLGYAALLGIGFVEFLLDAVPGIVLRLHGTVLDAGYWTAAHQAWAPSPLGDQQLAGDWLWFFAEAGDLPFLIALLVAWIRADAREARRIDAALDAAQAQAPTDGLWWQTQDPRR